MKSCRRRSDTEIGRTTLCVRGPGISITGRAPYCFVWIRRMSPQHGVWDCPSVGYDHSAGGGPRPHLEHPVQDDQGHHAHEDSVPIPPFEGTFFGPLSACLLIERGPNCASAMDKAPSAPSAAKAEPPDTPSSPSRSTICAWAASPALATALCPQKPQWAFTGVNRGRTDTPQRPPRVTPRPSGPA